MRILIVEDSLQDCLLLVHHIEEAEYEVEYVRVETAAALIEALDLHQWDVVISDYNLPGFSGTAALALVRVRTWELPFIFVSGVIGEDLAVAAMIAGANDYIMKRNMKRLVPAIERELRDVERQRGQRRLEQALERSEERFAKMFRASPMAIALLSPDCRRVLDANPAYARLAGGDSGEAIDGNAPVGVLAPADIARILPLLDREGGARNLELALRDAQGTEITALGTFERLELDSEHCVLMLLHTPDDAARAGKRAA
jgi:CheY-like chemotaxis protein